MSVPEDTAAALVDARPEDPAGLVLARARVEGALFGTATGLARFHVLERLGRGGMGVVYAAYDPELDRGVALKMIHVPARGRELAVAEAKALAKLSHPNVVPVFDVGVIEDHVYIVMELVRGETLRAWVNGKPVRAIVDAYVQAGAALAAAHDAGLVHRDFKPDNAIVGTDGRVRVVDFGLAHAALAPDSDGATARGGGTPRYMAPEQAAGAVTPAADQFSFCVALDEALRGDAGAPPPRWIANIVARGRSPDPAQRFASIRELLRALGRDPARAWRWRIGLGALAAAIGVAFFLGRARTAGEPAPCSGGDAEIAAAWPRPARDAQLARIAQLGAYGAELAPRLGAQLDAHAARWSASHRGVCLAHRRGVASADTLDRGMACLARSRAALAAAAEIVGAADAAGLPGAARAIAELPEPAACADPIALASRLPLPPPSLAPRMPQFRAELARAQIQLAAGRTQPVRETARAIAAAARAADYAPLLAESLLLEGRAAMDGDLAAARAAFHAAAVTALASGADAIAVEAWSRRAWIDGTRGERDAALGGLDVVDAIAGRAATAAFARALLYNHVGSVELAHGRRAAARAEFERAARAARGVTGTGAVELTWIRRNMALVTDDLDERDRLLAAAHTELVQLLGALHPEALVTQFMRAATSAVRFADAHALLAAACEPLAGYESVAFHAPRCFVELGEVRDELGDRAGALAAYERAARVPSHEHPPELAGTLALWRGDAAVAVRAFEAALAALPMTAGESLQITIHRAALALGDGIAQRAAGHAEQARAALARSVDAFAAVVATQPSVSMQRRLGRARAELAAIAPPAEARAHAAAALAWYRRAGGTPARIAELERLAR